MKKFKLVSPNPVLAFTGSVVLAVEVYCSVSSDKFFLLGFSILVRIFVLLWIPKAAKLVGRDPVFWTIFVFFFSDLGLIILGLIGYKKDLKVIEVFNKYNTLYNKKRDELLLKTNQSGENSNHQINGLLNELQEEAKQELNNFYDTSSNWYLTNRLKKTGIVIDDDSEVFVEVKEKCPACGSIITPEHIECPECKLVLKFDEGLE